MSKVAVVILNWNGSQLLERFIPPLIEHTNLDNVRLIVADNGSTDNSIVVLRQFPEIEILELDRNYGFAEGYNRALELIYAQYYVLLNSDVEVTSGWLEPMLNFLEEHPEYAICQPKIKAEGDRKMFEYAGAAGGEIDRFGYPFCRGRMVEHVEEDQGQYDQADREIFWASGACLMTRASVYTELWGLDADFWAHMEEIDFCWRTQNRGYKVAIVPQSTVYHVGGGSLAYGSPKKLFLNFRNNLFLLYKNLPQEKLLPILFQRMILDGLSALFLLLKGQPKSIFVVLKAHWHFYRSLPKLKQKRKESKAKYELGFRNLNNHFLLAAYYLKKQRTFSVLKQYKK